MPNRSTRCGGSAGLLADLPWSNYPRQGGQDAVAPPWAPRGWLTDGSFAKSRRLAQDIPGWCVQIAAFAATQPTADPLAGGPLAARL
jgi:hypothetical protein